VREDECTESFHMSNSINCTAFLLEAMARKNKIKYVPIGQEASTLVLDIIPQIPRSGA
jgi:hypothetical protein